MTIEKERIEKKLMWMNVDPWDSYEWLAKYIISLEDELSALKAVQSTINGSTPLVCKDCPIGAALMRDD